MNYSESVYEIYYKKLDNNGNTLVADKKLTSTTAYSWYPRLAVDSSNNIHIVWADKRDGNMEVYYTKLDDSGNTLVDDTRLSADDGKYSSSPNLAVDNSDNVHIAWSDTRDSAYEIYYTKLDSNGNTLVDDKRLTSDSSNSFGPPAMDVDNSGNVHIAWSDDRAGASEIYYTKLDNNGNTLVDDKRLTSFNLSCIKPFLGVDSSGNVHIVWENLQSSVRQVYYTKLDNNGNTDVDDTKLSASASASLEPVLGIDSSNEIHIAWKEDSLDIYYLKVDNDGDILVAETKLSFGTDTDNSTSSNPSLSLDGSDNIHIVWQDMRHASGNDKMELYYTKGKTDSCGTSTFYQDADSDGYGNSASTTSACSAPTGYVLNSNDCNDDNAKINPGANETCNGGDDNCNGQADDGLTFTSYYLDSDSDGYGNPNSSTTVCSGQPSGYVTDNTDCNDSDSSVSPADTEICDDGIDNNCDGQTDESGCTCLTSLEINDLSHVSQYYIEAAIGDAELAGVSNTHYRNIGYEGADLRLTYQANICDSNNENFLFGLTSRPDSWGTSQDESFVLVWYSCDELIIDFYPPAVGTERDDINTHTVQLDSVSTGIWDHRISYQADQQLLGITIFRENETLINIKQVLTNGLSPQMDYLLYDGADGSNSDIAASSETALSDNYYPKDIQITTACSNSDSGDGDDDDDSGGDDGFLGCSVSAQSNNFGWSQFVNLSLFLGIPFGAVISNKKRQSGK